MSAHAERPISVEAEEERAEVLRLLHQKVDELTIKIESLETKLLGALNEKDEMQRALEMVSLEASNYRAVKAIVYALSESRNNAR